MIPQIHKCCLLLFKFNLECYLFNVFSDLLDPLYKLRSLFPSSFHVSLYSRLSRPKRFAGKLKYGFQMTDAKHIPPVSSLCPFISPYLALYIADSADLIAPIESACEQSKLPAHSAEIKERAQLTLIPRDSWPLILFSVLLWNENNNILMDKRWQHSYHCWKGSLLSGIAWTLTCVW